MVEFYLYIKKKCLNLCFLLHFIRLLVFYDSLQVVYVTLLCVTHE